MKDLNLNYGVEIEIFVSKFRLRSLKGYIQDTLKTAKLTGWKVVEDSSCGLEVVSPILNGFNGYEQIRKVTKILKKLNCYTNKNCGLHIHIGAENLSVDDIRNVVTRYYNNQHHINTFIPKSRHEIYHSMPLDETFSRYFLNGGACISTISGLMAYQHDRYSHVNLYSLRKYGTIEFRQHQGTLDAEKIVNWIQFLTHFVEHTVFFQSSGISCFNDLFGHKLWLRDYYKKRANVLSRYYETHYCYNY